MSRSRWSWIAVLMVGCAPKASTTSPDDATAVTTPTDADAKVEAPEVETGPRYVMLWDGATLASGFDATADTARAYDSRSDAPATRRFWIMRKLAAHGEWLEVETVESDVHQCEPAFSGLDGYALRLYVRADETSVVTRREVMVTMPGNNRVTLSSGVRVIPPASEGQPTVALVDPPLPLQLPAEAIGHDYATPLRYDEGKAVGSVGLDALRLTNEIVLPERLGWTVLARKVEGPVTVITVADPCVRYELNVPTAAVNEPGLMGYGTGHGSGPPPRYTIPAGAPIYWPNGEQAGETRHEVKRADEPARREVGRACFAHAVAHSTPSSDPTLLLCFDEFDVRAVEPAAKPAK